MQDNRLANMLESLFLFDQPVKSDNTQLNMARSKHTQITFLFSVIHARITLFFSQMMHAQMICIFSGSSGLPTILFSFQIHITISDEEGATNEFNFEALRPSYQTPTTGTKALQSQS